MIGKSDSRHRRNRAERSSKPQKGIFPSLLCCSLWPSLVFRTEVSNGRASRLSKSAHSQLRMEGRRSRAHPAAEPWPSSHCETAQTGIAIHVWRRTQSEQPHQQLGKSSAPHERRRRKPARWRDCVSRPRPARLQCSFRTPADLLNYAAWPAHSQRILWLSLAFLIK